MIRRATIDDAATLAELYKNCFPISWHARDFQTLLAQPHVMGFISEDAFIIGQLAGDETEIITLGVTPAARRLGQARQMVEHFIAQSTAAGARRIVLEVSEKNNGAISLYQSLQFAPVGQRAGYYERPNTRENAIIMAKMI